MCDRLALYLILWQGMDVIDCMLAKVFNSVYYVCLRAVGHPERVCFPVMNDSLRQLCATMLLGVSSQTETQAMASSE